MKHPNIAGRFFNQPLMITEGAAEDIRAILLRSENGVSLSKAELTELRDSDRVNPMALDFKGIDANGQETSVRQIGLQGPLVNRLSLFTNISGMTSYQAFASQMQEATHDDTVKGIIVDVDSPGGEVGGSDVAMQAVRNAAAVKPVLAVVNSTMASGAYLVACAATEIIASPLSSIGSIGVIATVTDDSKAEEAEGIKTTYIHAGKAKTDGRGPLTTEAEKRIKERVDATYGLFVQIVADNRGIDISSLTGKDQDGIADGSTYLGNEALELGLVDRVGDTVEFSHQFIKDTMADKGTSTLTASTTADTVIKSDEDSELLTAQSEIERLQGELDDRNIRIQEFEVHMDKLEDERALEAATSFVVQAISNGQIASQLKDEAIEKALANFDGFKAAIDMVPKNAIAPLGEDLALTHDRDPDNGEVVETPEHIRIRKQLRTGVA